MKKQMKDMTEEERQKAYAGHRRQWGIDPDSDTISKESIAKFCDNFIGLMRGRLPGPYELYNQEEKHIRAEEQQKAYTFMKNVLVGGKYPQEGLNDTKI